LAPCGAACRGTGTRTSRRSTAAIFYAVTVLLRRTGAPKHSLLSRQQLALPFIRQVPAIQGGPLIGGGRWPRLLGRGCEPRLQAPPSRLRHRTPPEGALSEPGRCAPYV